MHGHSKRHFKYHFERHTLDQSINRCKFGEHNSGIPLGPSKTSCVFDACPSRCLERYKHGSRHHSTCCCKSENYHSGISLSDDPFLYSLNAHLSFDSEAVPVFSTTR